MSELYGGQWNVPGGRQPESGTPAYGASQSSQDGSGGAAAPSGAVDPWSPPGQSGYGLQPQGAYQPVPHHSGYPGGGYPVMQRPPLRSDYASWGKRVGANLIDGIPGLIAGVVFGIGYVMFIMSIVSSGTSVPTLSTGVIPMSIGGVIWLAALGWTLYDRWLLAGRTGQSVGKRATNIALISEETNAPIGPTNAFLRDLVHTVDGFAYVGYLWPLWDEKRQTFADKLMKTIVVDAPRRPVGEPSAAVNQAQPQG